MDSLRTLSLAFESSGSRVTRFEHNLGRALALPSQSVALLATLVLRGPQTTSELRANSERLHRFADLSSVEGFLEELATRSEEKGGAAGASSCRARAGAREQRWAHLLSGPVDVDAALCSFQDDAIVPASEAGGREGEAVGGRGGDRKIARGSRSAVRRTRGQAVSRRISRQATSACTADRQHIQPPIELAKWLVGASKSRYDERESRVEAESSRCLAGSRSPLAPPASPRSASRRSPMCIDRDPLPNRPSLPAQS